MNPGLLVSAVIPAKAGMTTASPVGRALADRPMTLDHGGQGPPYAAFFLPSNRPNKAMPIAPPTTAQSAMLNAGQ